MDIRRVVRAYRPNVDNIMLVVFQGAKAKYTPYLLSHDDPRPVAPMTEDEIRQGLRNYEKAEGIGSNNNYDDILFSYAKWADVMDARFEALHESAFTDLRKGDFFTLTDEGPNPIERGDHLCLALSDADPSDLSIQVQTCAIRLREDGHYVYFEPTGQKPLPA